MLVHYVHNGAVDGEVLELIREVLTEGAGGEGGDDGEEGGVTMAEKITQAWEVTSLRFE